LSDTYKSIKKAKINFVTSRAAHIHVRGASYYIRGLLNDEINLCCFIGGLCHSTAGLKHCYKTTVAYVYIHRLVKALKLLIGTQPQST